VNAMMIDHRDFGQSEMAAGYPDFTFQFNESQVTVAD